MATGETEIYTLNSGVFRKTLTWGKREKDEPELLVSTKDGKIVWLKRGSGVGKRREEKFVLRVLQPFHLFFLNRATMRSQQILLCHEIHYIWVLNVFH